MALDASEVSYQKFSLTQLWFVVQIMETLELSAISDRQWNIQACSALTKDGLNEGMEWMIQTINAKNQAQNSGAPAR